MLIQLLLHTDKYLAVLSQSMGLWLYGLVFLIVFCETGLVICPFLPGDSLLFALGSLVALSDSHLTLGMLSAVLLLATFLGDNVNYSLGNFLGPKIFSQSQSKFLNRKHLLRTHDFYLKYGPKAVIMARFIPIVRTFVPFVAGVGQMPRWIFLGYSLVGSVLWTQIFLWAGYVFGTTDLVRKNFQLVIFAVIVISILPAVWTAYKNYRNR